MKIWWLIVLIGLFVVIVIIPFSYVSCSPESAQCPDVLQKCADGCIPKNAQCYPDGHYCLKPITELSKCNSCPEDKKMCGMFCISKDQTCCFGGSCPLNESQMPEENNAQQNKINISLISSPNMFCTFQRNDLWSPDVPYDGSYVCEGSIILDFNGAKFPVDKIFTLYAKEISISWAGLILDEIDVNANTQLNRITFNYTKIGGDYFQADKPACPDLTINGLQLYDSTFDIDYPFDPQTFNVKISAEC